MTPADRAVRTGYVVFAHGSRIESANQAVRTVAADVACAGGLERVEAAFLELGQPDMEGAVAKLAAEGIRRVVIIPYFLTLGLHLERDLPAIVSRIGKAHPGVELITTPPLDGHPGLVTILLDRARGPGGPPQTAR
ncbi:MAG TPA: CbiX/SirB N-terminal domain-containing protein [Bryobacteraceae bacterium]|nr:CbiX/SirB N-terminal domain-containing protein [Bryobacteraceae bacterium]